MLKKRAIRLKSLDWSGHLVEQKVTYRFYAILVAVDYAILWNGFKSPGQKKGLYFNGFFN